MAARRGESRLSFSNARILPLQRRMSLPDLKDVSPGSPGSCRAAVGNSQIHPTRSVLKDQVNLPKENPRLPRKHLEKPVCKNIGIDRNKLCASKKPSLLSLKARRYSTGAIGTKVHSLSAIPKMDAPMTIKVPLDSTYVCKDSDSRNTLDDGVNSHEASIVTSEDGSSSCSVGSRTFVILDDDGNELFPDGLGPKAQFGGHDDHGSHAEVASAVRCVEYPPQSLMVNMESTKSLSSDHQPSQGTQNPTSLSSFFSDCDFTNPETPTAVYKYFSTPLAIAKTKSKIHLTPVIEVELERSSTEASSTTQKKIHHSKMENDSQRKWLPERLQLGAPVPEEQSLNTPLYQSFFATECMDIARQLQGDKFGDTSPDGNAGTQPLKRKWGMFDVSTIDAEMLPYDTTPMKSLLAFEAAQVVHSLDSITAHADQSMFGESILDLDNMDLQLMDPVVLGEAGSKLRAVGKESLDSELSGLAKISPAPTDTFKSLKDLPSFEGFDILGVALDELTSSSGRHEGEEVCDPRALATGGLNCTIDIHSSAVGVLPRDSSNLLNSTVPRGTTSQVNQLVHDAESSPSHTKLDEQSSDGQDLNLAVAKAEVAINTTQDMTSPDVKAISPHRKSELKILNLVNTKQVQVGQREQTEGSMKVVVNITQDIIESGQVNLTGEVLPGVNTTHDIQKTKPREASKVECSVYGNTTHEINEIITEANPDGEELPKALEAGLGCHISASSESEERSLQRVASTLSSELSLAVVPVDVEPPDSSRKSLSAELTHNESVFSSGSLSFVITSTPLPGALPFQFIKGSCGDSMQNDPSSLQRDPNVSICSIPEDPSCEVAVTDQRKSTAAKKGGNGRLGKPGASNTAHNSALHPPANSSQRSLFRSEIPSKATLPSGLPMARRSLALTSAVERPRFSKENLTKAPTGGRCLPTVTKTSSKSLLVNRKTQLHKPGVVTSTLTSPGMSPTSVPMDFPRTSLATIGDQVSKKESPSSNLISKPAQTPFQEAATQSMKPPSMMPSSTSRLYKFTGQSRMSSLGGPRTAESRSSLGGPLDPESRLSLGGSRAPDRMSLGAPRAPDSRMSMGVLRPPERKQSMGVTRAAMSSALPGSRHSLGAPRGSLCTGNFGIRPPAAGSSGLTKHGHSTMRPLGPQHPRSPQSESDSLKQAGDQTISVATLSSDVHPAKRKSSLPTPRSALPSGLKPPTKSKTQSLNPSPKRPRLVAPDLNSVPKTPPSSNKLISGAQMDTIRTNLATTQKSRIGLKPNTTTPPTGEKLRTGPASMEKARSRYELMHKGPPAVEKARSGLASNHKTLPTAEKPKIGPKSLVCIPPAAEKVRTGLETIDRIAPSSKVPTEQKPPERDTPRIAIDTIHRTPSSTEQPMAETDTICRTPANTEEPMTEQDQIHTPPNTEQPMAETDPTVHRTPPHTEKPVTEIDLIHTQLNRDQPMTGTDTTLHRTPPSTEQPMTGTDATMHRMPPIKEQPMTGTDTTMHRTPPSTEQPMTGTDTTMHRMPPIKEQPMTGIDTTMHRTLPNTEQSRTEAHTIHRTPPNTEKSGTQAISTKNVHSCLFDSDTNQGAADSARDQPRTEPVYEPAHRHLVNSEEQAAAQGTSEEYVSPGDSACLFQSVQATFDEHSPFQDCLEYPWNGTTNSQIKQELEEVKRVLAVRDVQCQLYVLKLKALEAQCEEYKRCIDFLKAHCECPNLEQGGMQAMCEEAEHPFASSSKELENPLMTLSEEMEKVPETRFPEGII